MTVPIALDTEPAARASFPIDFRLRDDEGAGALVITDDPAERHAHLEIINTSGLPLVLGAESVYHFALRFRPGVLSAASLTGMNLVPKDGWTGTTPQVQADGTAIMFLLHTPGATIAAGATVRLQLAQVGADGTGGARATQVELLYQGLTAADGSTLAGTRLIHLDLANRRGERSIPLHVGFAGTHSVLNDGVTPNALTVRLTNISATDVTLTGARLVLWFDSVAPFGLGTMDQLSAIDVTVADAADGWVVGDGAQIGQSPSWTVTHDGDEAALPAGDAIRIGLGNIVATTDSGDTNLYVRYENIPGYWDGTFVCTIEKSPILYDEHGHVGIGTTTPDRALQVGSGPGALGVQPSAAGPELRFGDQTGKRLRVGRARESATGAANAGATGALVTVTDGGNVGIGADDPQNPLVVRGALSGSPTEGRQVIVQATGRPEHEVALGVGMAGTERVGTISAAVRGSHYTPLLLNPFGGRVGVGVQGRVPNAALEVNGRIRSPMWQARTVVSSATVTLPHQTTVTVGGGTLLLMFHAEARIRPQGAADGMVGYEVHIDGTARCWVSTYPGAVNRAVALSFTAVVTGIGAGTYPLVIARYSDAPDTATGDCPIHSLTLVEFPF